MSLASFCPPSSPAHHLLRFLASKHPAASACYNRLRDDEFLSYRVLKAVLGDELPVPEEQLPGLLGPLQPRYYSACRAQTEMPDKRSFQFCFNVSRQWRDGACVFEGLASAWLERQILAGSSAGSRAVTFPVVKRESQLHFRLPASLTPVQPIIMIAAGTGVAPFVGFLDQLRAAGDQAPFCWLVFGCRQVESDFIFRPEIVAAQPKPLSRLDLAVSQPEAGAEKEKEYVQDVLRRESDRLFQLLMVEGARVYVCGDELGMIKGVNEVICELLIRKGVVGSEREAMQLLQQRIIRDIWI